MKKMRIQGKNLLSGTINISGAKNSALALIPAAILSDEEVIIDNIPDIKDIAALMDILKYLNCEASYNNEQIKINGTNLTNKLIPEELSNKLRASYYFMGALLGRFKKIEMYFPGGCNIGERPINLHIKGFESLGAKVTIDGDKYLIEADNLKGAKIYLDIASVGATINLMLAAVKATGVTIISNAAKEPEIVNVATFLNNMGAKITGAGTSEIKIQGVTRLNSATVEVIPDRIETGTYLIAGALIGDNLKITSIIKEHNEALLSKLKEMGAKIQIEENSIIISKSDNMTPINIKTLVYPGFPTDLGQPMSVLLTQCNGTSLFEETLYENRFGHVDHLNNMGADISRTGQNAIVIGPSKLKGAKVKATDLRAGAALVIAALIAEGESEIEDVEHILRGYENIVEKLCEVGAKITIEEI